MDVRAVSADEERKKEVVRVGLPKTRNPDSVRHFQKKLVDKGIQRLERHPVDGYGGVRMPPPKSGHGGKFTWEGPEDLVESDLEPVPPAIDPDDPNYVEEEEEDRLHEEGDDEVKPIGEVEVAKVAEAKEGVSRIDILPPPLQP
ncbi:uncharacterized protein [Typha latifolia]|uniref:uncharacterized protein n=1 Tax=Typha latifolia TaxID=4733 RepID=UPI003C2DDD32